VSSPPDTSCVLTPKAKLLKIHNKNFCLYMISGGSRMLTYPRRDGVTGNESDDGAAWISQSCPPDFGLWITNAERPKRGATMFDWIFDQGNFQGRAIDDEIVPPLHRRRARRDRKIAQEQGSGREVMGNDRDVTVHNGLSVPTETLGKLDPL
jgi:hypothetical protein